MFAKITSAPHNAKSSSNCIYQHFPSQSENPSRLKMDFESRCDSPEPNEIIPMHLEVQLENGSKQYLLPQLTDSPIQLATQFVIKHNLQIDMIDLLAQSIQTSIHQITINSQCNTKPKNVKIYQKVNSRSQGTQNLEFNFEKDIGIPLQNISNHHQNISKHQKNNSRFNMIKSNCKSNQNSTPDTSLYEKGKMQEEMHRSWIDKQRHKLIEKQLIQCTHKPTINRKASLSLLEQPPEIDNKFHSNQKIFHKSKQQLIQYYKQQAEYKIEKECYFVPKIRRSLNTSCESAKPRDKSTQIQSTVFQDLYEEHKVKEIRKSIIIDNHQKQHKFHPIINHISKSIVGDVTFNQRLERYAFEKMLKEEKRKIQSEIQEKYLYHPTTGPAPTNRNLNNLSIGQFLYLQKKPEPKAEKMKGQPHINQTSKQIYQKRKEVMLRRLYECLKTDETGKQLERNQFNMHAVNSEILQILYPLLEEIEIMQIHLNQEEFIGAAQVLFDTLNLTDKNKILTYFEEKKIKSNPKQNVQPSINPNSKKIVQDTQRAKMKIYDYCKVKSEVKEKNLEAERIEREKKHMKECTFQPKIKQQTYYY